MKLKLLNNKGNRNSSASCLNNFIILKNLCALEMFIYKRKISVIFHFNPYKLAIYVHIKLKYNMNVFSQSNVNEKEVEYKRRKKKKKNMQWNRGMKGLKEEENLFIYCYMIESNQEEGTCFLMFEMLYVFYFPRVSSKECYNKVLHDITD